MVQTVKRKVIKIDYGLEEGEETSGKRCEREEKERIIPYVDPKIFSKRKNNKNSTQLFSYNEKNDIYSIGVLLWEISSGKSPFSTEEYDIDLTIEISQGLREEPILNTSENYIRLYKGCWDGEPDNRPTMNIVTITTNEQIINESILSKSIIINEGKDAHKYIFDYFNSHNIKSHEIYNWLLNNQNDLDSIFLLGYFNYIGIEFTDNKNYSSGMNYLGYFCEDGIWIKKDTFKLSKQSTEGEYIGGIRELGYCYSYGTGTSVNKQESFKLYQQAADLGDMYTW
ncbi:hypothetical protein GLOIN_2v1774941 [Rhizophagus irregularis DAOM 181602=DAOM 197198]|uniref:Protein kinase domain-containing protein n=1 Tax=Rhizophagus irregularis (strain DAOM 181602 / DAOM 197198 / MUCL 43194) TaxID=747089 RepID=A0A2P4Q131_RHIID|nr:hypothetical protein GLOIN_2v1774941 [Rhizophagus irregularis DAOM 181602=DAOM 197198]POG71367.1 hypothetical protein GLOIN_2v1774941 [Rhizophagus irregularis DAOM 181602=DAOM 197198]|eukprot:XP_025178233.1 hypothetical protein GLOIN_2v1774941 [Rhizophagus irregularis DAOM 181602=DAOM 197198]